MFVWKLKISLVAWSIVFCFKEIHTTHTGLEGWKLASPSTTSEKYSSSPNNSDFSTILLFLSVA